MTTEEAIKRLEKLKAIYSGMDIKPDIKALDMAITALSADGDLISRKAVLKDLEEYARSQGDAWDNEIVMGAIGIVKELPTIPQVVCDDDCEHCSWTECPLPQKAEESPCNTCTIDCHTTCELYKRWLQRTEESEEEEWQDMKSWQK